MNILEKIKTMERKKLIMISGGILILAIIIVILIMPKGQQSEVIIGDITMAKGETSDKKAIGSTGVFSIDDPEIHAVVTIKLLPAGIDFEYQWFDLGSGKILKTDKRQSPSDFFGNSTSSIEKSEVSWDRGNYEFRVLVEGNIIAREEYSVKTTAEIEKEQIASSIKNVELVTSVDLRGNPTSSAKTIFGAEDKDIYASVLYQDAYGGVEFEGKWIYLKDNRAIKSFEKSLSGSGVFAFSINAESDSWLPIKEWAEGKYELDIYLNGELVQEIPFSIR